MAALGFGSGPRGRRRCFRRLLALVSLVAWLSLGAPGARADRQPRPAAGRRLHRRASRADGGRVALRPPDARSGGSTRDGALVAGTVARRGAVARARWSGVARRALLRAVDRCSICRYATVARDFLSFQWDNLLLECGLLAVFLPHGSAGARSRTSCSGWCCSSCTSSRASPSGSRRSHDWQDGSAMTYYYETAPLPTWLAFSAHHLPVWWHHLESRATLVLELVVPFAHLRPAPRRACSPPSPFTLLPGPQRRHRQLRLLLLPGASRSRLPARRRRRRARRPRCARRASCRRAGPPRRDAPAVARTPRPRRASRRGRVALGRSRRRGAVRPRVAGRRARRLHRAGPRRCRSLAPLLELQPALPPGEHLPPVRVHHARAHRARVPDAGRRPVEATTRPTTPPGPRTTSGTSRAIVARAPDFVAPAPAARRLPALVLRPRASSAASRPTCPRCVERMCEDPAAVQPLFRAPLPPHPAAVRIVYWQYHFASRRRAARHRRLVATARARPA